MIRPAAPVVIICVITCVIIWAALLATPTAHADIYKYVDENGVVHLADRKLGPRYRLILRTRKPPAASQAARGLSESRRRFDPLVRQAASHYGLPSALVHAVITAESSYDPLAVSRKGAVGLMQLMPTTARRYDVRDPRDPVENVHGGTRYLRDLLLRFQDLALALAAYNAGEDAVIRSGNRIPPYRETRDYVRKVLTYYRQYRSAS